MSTNRDPIPNQAESQPIIDSLLNDLLLRTSRTFALAIPMLPQPARREVTIAYLLFRVADIIEDGIHLSRDEKLACLERLGVLLTDLPRLKAHEATLALPRDPSDNADYQALLAELPGLLAALSRQRSASHAVIVRSVQTSLSGMQRFIASGTGEGAVQISALNDLRDYCYTVAGVVGDMLTKLFLLNATWLEPARAELESHARWFGEGLQLVNILKDSAEDERAGRRFIPDEIPRSLLFQLTRADLRRAELYVDALRCAEAPRGFVAFTELPLALAWRTLDCVQTSGPGSKVPRANVLRLVAQTLAAESVADPSTTRVRGVTT
jgi:farnesyl-diphosphate farnesyltransferase